MVELYEPVQQTEQAHTADLARDKNIYRRQILADAAFVLDEHGAKHPFKETRRGIRKQIDNTAIELKAQITDDQGTFSINWEAIGASELDRSKCEPSDFDMPLSRRVVFSDIVVDTNKDGTGNPAMRYDFERGNMILEKGGIDRNEDLIVEAIKKQVSRTAIYYSSVRQSIQYLPDKHSHKIKFLGLHIPIIH